MCIRDRGNASHCGKTTLTAAICRILTKLGYKVAPFKAQNMSLNSYVTEKGEEISRSQAFQAFASGIEPSSDMNPILIKPKSDRQSQIVLYGKPFKDVTVNEYYRNFALNEGLKSVKESLQRLASQYDFVIVEGAGSPAEVNLDPFEIANMRVAELADASVLLVGDIDRGGVFASLVGTMRLLKRRHRRRVKGFIINKFRGDISLLKPGIKEVEKITRKPVLGVVPFITDLRLPAEDSLSIEDARRERPRLNISIIRLPKISNFTDFEPFRNVGVEVRYVDAADDLDTSDAIIIPGTKNTLHDLFWMKACGIAEKIRQRSASHVPLIGICGGFQMLGKSITDESGSEGGRKGVFEGLNLLDVSTTFREYSKVTERVAAEVVGDGPILSNARGARIDGYEIHMGVTEYAEKAKPLFKIVENEGDLTFDGAVSRDGLVFGTYLHGVFDQPALRNALLSYLTGVKNLRDDFLSDEDVKGVWERDLNLLVKTVETSLDMRYILSLLGVKPRKRRLG